MRLTTGKFRLRISEDFLTGRCIRLWNSFPRIAVEDSLREALKTRQDKGLENVEWEKIIHFQRDGMDNLIGLIYL